MSTVKTNFLILSICGLFATLVQASSLPANSSSLEVTRQAAEILDLTNRERINAGLKPLSLNTQLMEVAQAQSSSMAHESALSHDINGKDLVYRTKAVGYPFFYVGENIAQATFSIKRVIKMWMESESHRMHILDSNFEEIGIGIAEAPDGYTYYTQVFGVQ